MNETVRKAIERERIRKSPRPGPQSESEIKALEDEEEEFKRGIARGLWSTVREYHAWQLESRRKASAG